jgi:integrase
LEAVGTDRLGALYTLCFSTGLRQGEALALRWEDVDTEQGVLRVGYTLRRVRLAPNQPRTLLRSDTKTVASRRVLPLAPFVAAAIQHHRERQLFERRAADDNWNDTGYVFTDKVGRPVEADHLGRSFAVFLLRAGLPRMRFHDLRHSCATLLLAAGVPPRTVMSYLGHSNLGTTMAIYGHVSPHMLGEAAATMQKQLAGTPS